MDESATAFKKTPASRKDGSLVVIAMVTSLGLKLRHLGHRQLTKWDEAYHAIVARNLLRHPLKPTLIDKVYFSDPYKNWTMNHVWLHKPVLPLWQIMVSFWMLGVNAFSLRLPSSILSVAAVGLTYLIGKRLVGSRAAVVAAILQAFSPVIVGQVQGYMIADHVDTALLFWVEVGIFFLIRGIDGENWKDWAIAGICAGLAILSKNFLGLLVPGLGIATYLMTFRQKKVLPAHQKKVRLAHPGIILGAAALTILPWTLWCYSKYRQEFLWENFTMLRHVNDQIGGWGAPWYRAAYSYLMFLFDWTYLPVGIAIVAATVSSIKRRDERLGLLVIWGGGIIVSTLVAGTKTPLAAILAVPAAWLMLGWLISEACRGDRVLLALAAATMACCVLWPPHRTIWQEIMPTPAEFNTHPMSEASWMAWRLGCVSIATILLIGVGTRIGAGTRARVGARIGVGMMAAVWTALAVIVGISIERCYEITSINADEGNMIQVAATAREKLPANGVLLVDERRAGDTENLAFGAAETVYSLKMLGRQTGVETDNPTATEIARITTEVRVHGGAPYLVSYRQLPYPKVADCPADGFSIYAPP